MLEDKDFERLDERYVKKDSCVDLRAETDKRIDTILVDVAVTKTRLGVVIAILAAIAAPVLAIAVKLLLGV